MLNRYDVQRVIEEWRDEQIVPGVDSLGFTALLDEEKLKSLADRLMWKIRENA